MAALRADGRNRPQAGFTLLEVMIAAFVFAIAFTGIYGVYAGVMDVAEQVRDEGEALQSGRLVLRQIGDDLFGLVPPSRRDQGQDQGQGQAQDQNEPALMAGGERREEPPDASRDPDLARSFRQGRIVLELTTCSSLDFEDAARGDRLVRVRYVLRSREDAGVFDDEGPWILVRQERLDPAIRPDGSGPGLTGAEEVPPEWSEVELCDRVMELSLTFRARSGREAETWGTDGLGGPVASDGLPAGVRLRLVVADERRDRVFSDVLSLDPELLPERTENS